MFKLLDNDNTYYNCTNTYYAFISVVLLIFLDIYINNMNDFFVYLILLFYRLWRMDVPCLFNKHYYSAF